MLARANSDTVVAVSQETDGLTTTTGNLRGIRRRTKAHAALRVKAVPLVPKLRAEQRSSAKNPCQRLLLFVSPGRGRDEARLAGAGRRHCARVGRLRIRSIEWNRCERSGWQRRIPRRNQWRNQWDG